MAILDGHKQNFETLQRAFASGDVALVECRIKATGETAVVLCATQCCDDDGVEFIPFAQFFNDNPYDILEPPMSDDGDSNVRRGNDNVR